MQPVRRPSAMRSESHKVAVPRTRNENGGSEQVPADGGGKRGAGLRKRKDSAEGVVVLAVVVNAHPPRTPHDHMERINRPFADDQLDFSIVSLAENVVFFPLYPGTTRFCTPSPPGELAKYTLAHWVRLPVSFFSVPCSQ